jgi:hypothetical protein
MELEDTVVLVLHVTAAKGSIKGKQNDRTGGEQEPDEIGGHRPFLLSMRPCFCLSFVLHGPCCTVGKCASCS